MVTMPQFAPNWAAIAQIMGSALAAPQGQYAQGAAQGAQNYQGMQDMQLRRQMQQQQMQLQQEEAERARTAEQDRERQNQAYLDMLNPQRQMTPARQIGNYGASVGGAQSMQTASGTPSPFANLTAEQRAFLTAAGRETGLDILGQQMFQDSEPVRGVEMAGRLVNPITGEVITDLSAEEVALRQASRPVTNVTTNVASPKSILAGDNKLLEIGAEGFTQAQEIMPLFDIAETAAQNFSQSGPLGGGALFIERTKNYLGMPNNANAGEVLQGMQTRLGTLLRVPGSGATSNMEMSLYMQGVPGLLNSQQGNIALARIGKKLVQKRMADFQKLQAYVQQNGTSVGYQPDESPLLTPEETQMLLGAGMPQEQEDAPTATGPNGERLILRNGQWEPM